MFSAEFGSFQDYSPHWQITGLCEKMVVNAVCYLWASFFVGTHLYQKWIFIIMLCFEVNVQIFWSCRSASENEINGV